MCKVIALVEFLLIFGCGGFPQESYRVYNNAYAETYDVDTLSNIERQASGAYVLLEPFQSSVDRSTVLRIASSGNAVAAYMSVGTAEQWRDDFDALRPYATTKEWEDWPGEYFISDTQGASEVMKKRIDRIASMGFEWIEFDNMDWLTPEHRSRYDLNVTEEEAVAYVQTLCRYARSKGLKCMAKNRLASFENFDGVTYESVSGNENWWDSTATGRFIKDGKPVIVVHYDESDCDRSYRFYQDLYGKQYLGFICEDTMNGAYRHYP